MTNLGTLPNMFEMAFAAQRSYLDFWTRAMTSIPSMPVQPARRGHVVPVSVAAEQREQVIGIGEESLDVSTRRVSGEATRVRRVVKEVPVERRVELHDETITIERRAPNGQPADGDSLTEREYVMIDTREIPVVTKHANLREELVIRREVAGRVEVIRDTVRHADVEVEQPQRMPMIVATHDNNKHNKDHKNRA